MWKKYTKQPPVLPALTSEVSQLMTLIAAQRQHCSQIFIQGRFRTHGKEPQPVLRTIGEAAYTHWNIHYSNPDRMTQLTVTDRAAKASSHCHVKLCTAGSRRGSYSLPVPHFLWHPLRAKALILTTPLCLVLANLLQHRSLQ